MRFEINKASDSCHDQEPPCKGCEIESITYDNQYGRVYYLNHYYKEIKTIEELKEIEEEAGDPLIIGFNPPTILIYDSYIE